VSGGSDQQLVWKHTVEGLVRMGKPRATPRWKQRLKDAGLDVEAPVAAVYTRDQWRSFIFISAEELFEGEPDARFHAMGHAFIEEYAQTFLGRAVAAVLKIIGPKRALERMTKSLRSGNNYSETRTTFLGPARAEFWLNETLGAPSYICGALEAVLATAGAKATVRVAKVEGTSATFDIVW